MRVKNCSVSSLQVIVNFVAWLVIARRNFSFDVAIWSSKLKKIAAQSMTARNDVAFATFFKLCNKAAIFESLNSSDCRVGYLHNLLAITFLFQKIAKLKLKFFKMCCVVTIINLIIVNESFAAFTCNISVPTVDFGVMNPSANKAISVTASVTCSGSLISLLISYTVTFSTGSSNIYNPRNMLSNSNVLTYNLYKNSAASQILGNGTNNTVTITDSYLLGLGAVTKNYTIYATLPAQPLASVGTYQDTITATVSY